MADLVRGIVEASLPELNEWHQRGLFSYVSACYMVRVEHSLTFIVITG